MVMTSEPIPGILASKTGWAVVKKYIVDLSGEERALLLRLTSKGKASARKVKRAHSLLLAAEDKPDEYIAEALHLGLSTVARTRQKFVEGGLEFALSEGPRPGAARKLAGKQEAFLVALAGSQPPQGRKVWSMQLLAERLVSLGMVEAIADETVRRTLKKRTQTLAKGTMVHFSDQRGVHLADERCPGLICRTF
jgi:transposase